MKSVTDAATASMAGTTGLSVWYGYINQGAAFVLLMLSIALTIARLWSWWEERQGKRRLPNPDDLETITTATRSSDEADGLFY